MEVPTEIVEKCNGFALDAGETLAKIVYISKSQDEKQTTNARKETGLLRLATFALSDLDKLVDFIQKECLIKRTKDGEVPVMYSTGLYARQVKEKLEKELNVRLVNARELKCLAQVLPYLCKTLPAEQVFELPKACDSDKRYELENYSKIVDGCVQLFKHRMGNHTDKLEKMLSELADERSEDGAREEERRDDVRTILRPETVFPCLLVVLGAGTTLVQIEEDGSFQVVDAMGRGGAPFLGLGALLSDQTDYCQLMKMADVGDAFEVDQGNYDFIAKDSEKGEDWYAKMKETVTRNEVTFCFGKTPGKTKDDFKAADLARSLTQVVSMELTQLSLHAALAAGLKRIYYCGSFLDSGPVRHFISNWFFKRKCIATGFMGEGEEVELAFLKHGAHLGALGAILAACEP